MVSLFSSLGTIFVRRNALRSTILKASLPLFLILALVAPAIPTTHAAVTPSLGAAATYGILASTYTNTSAGTTINGDVGFTTGPAVAPAGTHPHYGSGAPYATAGSDQGNALSSLASQPCTYSFPAGAINLSTDTTHGPIGVYLPGVYCSAGAMNIGGPLTLSGNGTFIFRSVGALTSTAGAIVSLTGASACNVFWTPTQATTLAANTTFAGIIIDNAGITVGANTVWSGMALAYGGTVTTDTTTLSVPVCSTISPATLHVIKEVIGGSLSPSNFSLHVKNAGIDVAGSPAAGAALPGTSYVLNAGTYTVSEDANPAYSRSISGDCSASGTVLLAVGNDKTCTITNTTIPVPASASSSAPVIPAVGSFSPLRPVIGVTKVPSPTALPAAGSVTYTYAVSNLGLYPMNTVTLTDDKCSAVTLVSGDSNNDALLQTGEVWTYRCTARLTQNTTNKATAIGYANGQQALAAAYATVRVGMSAPAIHVTKRASPSFLPSGGGTVTYAYALSNPGDVALRSVTAVDNKCSPVTYRSGDFNGNNLLDPDETWNFSCQADLRTTTTNTVTATGIANSQTVTDTAIARVTVAPVSSPIPPPASVPPPLILPVTGVDLGSTSVQLVLSGLLMVIAFVSLSGSRQLRRLFLSKE